MMGGKKIKGRKRHIITDTEGFVLGCYVGAANENDREGIINVIENMTGKYGAIEKIWADMGYQGKDLKDRINQEYKIDLEIIKRPQKRFWIRQDTPCQFLPTPEEGFKVQPRRWVVERTFAWLGRNRRLSKEYEFDTNSSINFIYIAMNRLILRRNYA